MNRFVSFRPIQAVATRVARGNIRCASNVPYHHDRTSSSPLIEHYRSAWPDVRPDVPEDVQIELPERTIPDEHLRFNFTTTFSPGGSYFFTHLESNPADFKVLMKVYLKDLQLSPVECRIFTRMVGKRLKVGNGELKLTCNKFPNKMENRKYLILQLEQLITEAKRLALFDNKYVDGDDQEVEEEV